MKKSELKDSLDLRGFRSSLREAFGTPKKAASALLTGFITFLIVMLLFNPVYSYQMLSSDPANLPLVISTMMADQTLHGFSGIAITAVLALLVGTVTVKTLISLKRNYDSTESVTTTFGTLIGFASAGCASCGAGVLALLGVTGGAAVLPFNGSEVQVLTISILIGSMEYTGRQEGICRIK